MGHLVFLVLHLFAVLFGLIGLFVTIPLHLIYTAVRGSRREAVKLPSAPAYLDRIVIVGIALALWWALSK